MSTSLVAKLIKGDPSRKSRLHSGRGQLLPFAEVPSAVRSAGYRLAGRYPDGPWMTPGSVRRLRQSLTKTMTLLELGSGVSTAWYADRVGHVVSLEPEQEWYDKVREQLGGRSNCELLQTNIESELRRIVVAGDRFDVVIVDYDEVDNFTRPQGVELACAVANDMVVLDDSDRPQYSIADSYMTGWKIDRYPGMKSVPLSVWETTIYSRHGVG